MGTFVAMLRSINVGGRNRVAMADLRALVTALGFDDVTTYLQSGNVVMTGAGTPQAVAHRIEEAITAELGLTVPVVVRSRRQLEAIVEGTPYAGVDGEPTLFHVTFLTERPRPAAVQELASQADRFGADTLEVVGSDVYLHCPGGYGVTTLNNAYLEKHLGVTATTRNWRSVTALAQMAGSSPAPG